MFRFFWVLPFALFSCKGQPMTGAEIAALLPDRIMVSGGPAKSTKNRGWQYWRANGTTMHSGFILRAFGHWKVEGDLYCELLGIEEEWRCYRLYRRPGPDGISVHFDGTGGWTGFVMPEDTPFP